jgi:adenylosuccinate synthase
VTVDVVIGANYGDEGKGLVTEFLCLSRPGAVVALANGGCQRGHTVTDRAFGRHVFHHFGSGTFRGAPTCFCRDYLLNPMQFVKEYTELEKAGARPVSYREAGCRFQLPVDVYLNRLIEKSRGAGRHGSVGCGIWESVKRLRSGGWLTFSEFAALGFGAKLDYVRQSQRRALDARLAETGLSPDAEAGVFLSDGMVRHFVQDCEFTAAACRQAESVFGIRGAERVVFEQGQGLALDQLYGKDDVDHTTPSYTGLAGVAEYLKEKGYSGGVAADYVTRSYTTRHGAGPFPEEDPSISFPDETNMPNDWQGAMRFGEFRGLDTAKRIGRDLAEFRARFGSDADPRLFVTHVNEMPRPEGRRLYAASALYESASVYADEIRRLR